MGKNSLEDSIVEKSFNLGTRISPSIKLHSWVVSKFHSLLKLPKGAKLLLENCVLEKFVGSWINLKNPKILKVNEWTIHQSGRSGITVVISEINDIKAVSRTIEIKDSGIVENKMNGVEIYCSDFTYQNLNLSFLNSRFLVNGQDGLFIARMAINSMEIKDCKFLNNEGKGCVIKIIHQLRNHVTFKILSSKFNSNKDIGLQIDDSGVNIADIQCNSNGKNGLSINGTFKPNELSEDILEFLASQGMDTKIDNITTNGNFSNGISIKSYWKGKVVITRGSVLRNVDDGIFLYNQIAPSNSNPKNLIPVKLANKNFMTKYSSVSKTLNGDADDMEDEITENINLIGKLILTDLKISKNKRNGLSLKNACWILHPWVITGKLGLLINLDNRNHAIYMEREEDKYKLHVPSQDVANIIIKGKTGGPWGKLNVFRTQGCWVIQ